MATVYMPGQDNEEEENQQGQSALNPQLTTGLTGASSGGQMQSAASPNQQQRKGSGRFTNLQRYLDANRQGGQRVAAGIGENIQGEAREQREETERYLGGIREGIQQAQQTAQQGSGFLQELRGIGQNIQQRTGAQNVDNRTAGLGIRGFTERPDFNQFQEIQSGRGIDENLLQQQQQNLRGATQQFLGTSEDALNRLGTEGGRFGLLKETFGGAAAPQYSTGQQRLDQLFLARQGLAPLQEEARQNVRAARGFATEAGQIGNRVGDIIAQERGLISDIDQQTMQNRQAYLDMLSSYVPEIQRRRDAQWQALEDAVQSYRQPTGDQVGTTVIRPGLTREQQLRLGLDRDRQFNVYDTFDNISSASDIATRGREARSIQDIATQSDVARYRALAQMAGVDPEALTQAGNLGEVYTAREGDANLRNRLIAEENRVRNIRLNEPGQIDRERVMRLTGTTGRGFDSARPLPMVTADGSIQTINIPLSQLTPREAQSILEAADKGASLTTRGDAASRRFQENVIRESLKSILENDARRFDTTRTLGGDFMGGEAPRGISSNKGNIPRPAQMPMK